MPLLHGFSGFLAQPGNLVRVRLWNNICHEVKLQKHFQEDFVTPAEFPYHKRNFSFFYGPGTSLWPRSILPEASKSAN